MAKKQGRLEIFGLSKKKALDLLRQMWEIRLFEERVYDLLGQNVIKGASHLYAGEEAVAVGAISTLHDDDLITSTHRGHGHCHARGASLVKTEKARQDHYDKMMAELCGRETGYCLGRGGSMHIADVESNNLGANGIVGGGVPIAAGVGLSIKLRKSDQVCLVIFGDGAANEGAFHESINMSSIWKLPVVYLCENNQYGMSMSVKRAFNVEFISQRAAAYGIPGVTVDGNDMFSVYDAISQAAAHARSGQGPVLVESLTYRWRGHSKSDRQLYRTRDEVKEWQSRDPIPRFANTLVENQILRAEEVEQIRQRAYQRVEEAVKFAEASPEPEVSTIMEGVYA